MRCFQFSNGGKTDEPKTTKYASGGSITSTSMDLEVRKSGSECNSQNISDTSSGSSAKISFASLSLKPSNLRVFTFAELKTATKNFSRALMLGEGGFGPVYRGVLRETEGSTSFVQGHKEWVTEVNVLGIVDHPHLVKLIGYCAEDDERGIQRLLVYEYMPNRSVQDHISSRFHAPLPWTTRLKVAQDAARGLAYLHEGMEFQIIFRDFKSSNILLDEQWNAKLSDFGLAKLGPTDGLSHVSTAVVGTVGYAAPEYIQTGRLTTKSDVWSYGIFLYELITGRRPFDRNRPKDEQKLLDWIRPHLSDMKKFEQILDPRLNGKYDFKSAQKLAAIANRCLVRHPKNRPRMSDVLEMVNHVVKATGSQSPDASVERALVAAVDEESLQERLKRKILDHIMGDNKCLSWKSWRREVVSEEI
ncbi:Protein kinase superfamily protein [Perilla frutescens var. hirtella]|uniref:Protein kinase superfamily protein n=1 Tax=Perilla frutescens var. hirtella TaxID=608512 RepID=A0AAD4PGM6_PERFH|nr:Protein kinase superfamily protein [Perilla frutescens var. frutescens]KAH6784173.1 Protein kinase superfamily protein [Perilla frutescens var. hirtella]KAH6838257.1 Protein kinase superfamily protein [Perilla frutescens var. hirtella]